MTQTEARLQAQRATTQATIAALRQQQRWLEAQQQARQRGQGMGW